MFDSLIKCLIWPFELLLVLLTGYQIIIGLPGLLPVPRLKPFGKPTRFCILIPAHNEELVIDATLDAVSKLTYPHTCYLIADHCADKTAEIARRKGVTVLKRDEGPGGKGYAIKWSLEWIRQDYDYLVILDADNVIHPDFLHVMTQHIAKGEELIQGYLGIKNPFDTWVTKCYTFAYLTTNRAFQLARYRLGLCCALGGTGMCISKRLIDKHGWNSTSLTEDLEFQVKALLDGVKTTWAHGAIVYDEKPRPLSVSWKQRTRWMQGHTSVARDYARELLSKGLRERNLSFLDTFLYTVQPARSIFVLIILVLAIIGYINPVVDLFSWKWWLGWFSIYVLTPSIYLIREKAPLKLLLHYPFYLFYTWTWIPIIIIGAIKHRRTHWYKTPHVANFHNKEIFAERAAKNADAA